MAVRDEQVRTLWERDLVLVRPDQHVAWRSDRAPAAPAEVLQRIQGAGPDSAPA